MEYKGNVAKQIAIGLLLIAVLATCLWFVFPAPEPTDRLNYTLKWSALFSLPLFIGIHVTLFARFSSEDLIKGYSSASKLEFNQAYLSNTVEQTTINVLAALSLGMLVPTPLLKLIPIQAVIFVVGRILYFASYKSAPMNRFVGFVMGYYVAVFSLLGSIYWGITG